MIDGINKETQQNTLISAGQNREFRRRYYSNWRIFWQDFQVLLSQRNQIKKALREDCISPAFRERLMMAVTEVNDCRYCRSFHVQQAYQAGLSEQEIQTYLSGIIPENMPPEEKLAVCYAKYWAENDAQPDLASQNQIREAYGEEGFDAIQIILRMIRMGNLLGNTGDYILFWISYGRLGNKSSER
jgi:AhpD family alkylhydroperoxidase